MLIARLLLILSVVLMPLGMAPTEASVSIHSGMAGMSSHCPDQHPGHGAKGALADCAMACASALPAGEEIRDSLPFFDAQLPDVATIDPLHGIHPEMATPPPRLS